MVVESTAGVGIGASDEQYRTAGAEIVVSATDIFAKADMIVKVKEPQPNEWVQLSANQILFTYLHLAADAPQEHQSFVDDSVFDVVGVVDYVVVA